MGQSGRSGVKSRMLGYVNQANLIHRRFYSADDNNLALISAVSAFVHIPVGFA